MSEIADFLVKLMVAGDHGEQVPDIKRTKWMFEQMRDVLGCECDFQIFNDTANVYATFGDKKAKTLCFCGHCDVVPARNWTKNPSGEIVGDRVYGRGAVDMLGSIACWFFALKNFIKKCSNGDNKLLKNLRIATILTGDEEGDGTYGTKRMIEYLMDKGEKIDACITGEPTSGYFLPVSDLDHHKLDGLCYSRAGSFTFWIKVKGKSGHIAQVGNFDNPIYKATKLCERLKQIEFKEFGDMTNLEILGFDAFNNTCNIILDDVKIYGNVRFFADPNKSLVGKDLIAKKIEDVCRDILEKDYELRCKSDRNGYTIDKNNDFFKLVSSCFKKYNNNLNFVVSRGCTDSEYMAKMTKNICEIGLKNKMAHKIDEYTTISDLEDLSSIYESIIFEYAKQSCQ